MKVIAYLCQYKGQDALSTDAQLEQIQIYANRHHLEIVEIIKDTQHVANLKQKSGLKRALERCQKDPNVGFIIARLDCLTRSLKMLRALISGSIRLMTLFSVEEELDTRTRAGRSMLGILESISQWESEIKQIEAETPRHQHRALDVPTDWWNIYGRFEGRLFRPEPPSLSINRSAAPATADSRDESHG